MIRGDLIFDLIVTFCEKEGVQLTLKESSKRGFLIGLFCTIVSILLGPIGLLFGGIFGGFLGYWSSPKYKPVHSIIRQDFTEDEKIILIDKIRPIVSEVGPEDVLGGLMMLTQTPALKSKFIETVNSTVHAKLSNSLHSS